MPSHYQKQEEKSHSNALNLSEAIPFDIGLSNTKTKITLTKGVMSGEITLDSIALELEKELGIPSETISFKKDNQKNVWLKIKAKRTMNIEELQTVTLETISKELPLTLCNNSTRRQMIFITREIIGVPLIGSIYFGIIDRGTNILQIRPITGCSLNCPFCSVDEGPATKTKIRDFIIDPDYLIESYNQVVEEKGINDVEAHLDGQGEPVSYPYLTELVQQLRDIPATEIISIQTNGLFLSEKLIDNLSAAGLSRINLSVNSIDLRNAKRLSGRGDYPLERILGLAEYIANSDIALLIAPVWVPGWNDEDIEEIVHFALRINSKEERYPILGIQNYLTHPEGRNVRGVKVKSFRDFNHQLREMEKKFGGKKLILKPSMFKCYKTKMIANPMKLNERVLAKAVLPGRMKDEIIAVAKNRLIQVANARNLPLGSKIKVKITRNRHNIFFAKPA